MKRIKFITSFIVAMTMTIMSATVNATEQSSDTFTVNDITFEIISDSEVAIIDNSDNFPKYTGELKIPDNITYDSKNYCVTKIKANAFRNCMTITSVVFPETLSAIGDNAFEGCENLSEIDIPYDLKELGEYAFASTGLTTFHIKSWAISCIPQSMFKECTRLETVTLHSNIRIIESSAFEGCVNLREIIIPSTLLSIESEAFKSCSAIRSIVLSEICEKIGQEAFADCKSLEFIDPGLSLKSIGKSAFSGCRSLQNISFPENCTDIQDNAFAECDIQTISFLGKMPFTPLDQSFGKLNYESLTIAIKNPDELQFDTDAFIKDYPELFNDKYKVVVNMFDGTNFFIRMSGSIPLGARIANDMTIYSPNDTEIILSHHLGGGISVSLDNKEIKAEQLKAEADAFPWYWNEYKFIPDSRNTSTLKIDLRENSVGQTETSDSGTEKRVYSLDGTEVFGWQNTDSLPAGIYIVRQGSKTSKIMVR